MAREINDTQPYSAKLVKLIPTEIVGAYMVLLSILVPSDTDDGGTGSAEATAVARLAKNISPQIKSGVPAKADQTSEEILMQVVFFVLLVLTPIYLRMVSKVTNITQLVLSTMSFVVWVYTLGGPFVTWDAYNSKAASVILILWSLIPPLFISTVITKKK